MTAGKPLDHAYTTEDAALVKAGCCNLARHVTNTRKYGVPVVVAINKFATDTEAELAAVREAALEAGTTPCMSCVWLTLVASFCLPSCVSASTMVIPCAICCLVATFGVSKCKCSERSHAFEIVTHTSLCMHHTANLAACSAVVLNTCPCCSFPAQFPVVNLMRFG